EELCSPCSQVKRNGHGFPRVFVCKDDDPTCDFGPVGDHACTFRVSLCFNVVETRFQCVSPGAVESVSFLREANPSDKDVANRDALESALTALGGTVQSGDGIFNGRAVVYNPPLTGPNTCTPFAEVRVPLGGQTTGVYTKHHKVIAIGA